MKWTPIFLVPILLIIPLAGCSLPTSSSDLFFIDQTLMGEVSSNSFTFASGFATTNQFDTDQYTIYLFPSEPSSGLDPWETGAYTGVYPYLYFSIEKNSTPQTYDIATLGIGGLSLTGLYTSTDGVWFDIGKIRIDSINTISNEISGVIWARTNEGTSSVNGNFIVAIEH